MYSYEFYVQSKGNYGAIKKGIISTATSIKFNSMVSAVAYASKKGCIQLIGTLESEIKDWEKHEKTWIISIDYGLTEPQALLFLSELPNSKVFIPNALEVIQNNLFPKNSFHSKLFYFATKDNNSFALFSGSANLTYSGLYLNQEQGVSSIWFPPLSDEEKSLLSNIQSQLSLLETYIDPTNRFNKKLQTDYEKKYEELKISQKIFEDENQTVENIDQPDPELDFDKSVSLATARSFWVEVEYVVSNLGKGKPGNQIDLQRGSRVFFGFGIGNVPRNTSFGHILIQYKDFISEYNLRFGNNSMDKLNLPAPGEKGPPTYENQTLHFQRDPENENLFILTIGSKNQIAEWSKKSSQQGTLYSLRSGRKYGVYN